MAEQENKIVPLLGFAGGIEVSQVIIVLTVLLVSYLVMKFLKVNQRIFIIVGSSLILLITIPMLIDTFPL